MLEEIKNIKSGKKELRRFGITLGVVLVLLGGVFFLRGKNYYLYFLAASAIFLFLGLAAPALLRPIQKVWMSLAVLIGWFITRIILIVLFYLVVTPIGTLIRMFGKDFLGTKFDINADSYWLAKVPAEFDKGACENQF